MLLTVLKSFLSRHEKIRIPIYRIAMKFIVKPYVNNLEVPIIAITGTNGKTTITRLLNRIYLDAGYNVGACSTEGVMHNGVIVKEGDRSGGGGVWRAAKCPHVNILILEIARKAIINYDLGFKNAQVGIVTNIYEDHLGYNGILTLEQMAELKSTIVKITDPNGCVILNGDDYKVRNMAKLTKAKKIFFVTDTDYEKYNNAYFLKDSFIWKKNDGEKKCLMDIEKIPITMKGVQKYNVTNIMAALAAVDGMKKYIKVNRKSLYYSISNFGKNANDNLGRFNFIHYKKEDICLCYAKNPESYRREIEIIAYIKKTRGYDNIIGIMTAMGNRSENYFKNISKIIAHVCDLFFIRPPKDEYLRGRTGDEIVRLLSYYIPDDKIASKEKLSLEQIFEITNQKYQNKKNLFILFYAPLEDKINLKKVVKIGDYFSTPINNKHI